MPAMQFKAMKTVLKAATVCCGLLLTAGAVADSSESRALSFYHTHTGERLTVTYWEDGAYIDSALEEINRFLRDFRTGDEITMDPALLDILHTVYRRTGSSGHFEVISAYRSPATNAMLRSRSNGVAQKSQHLHGRAIDVRLTDIPTKALRQAVYELERGGVGYYERSNFVHIDTGRFRTW
jgi:uncharacterized protein YcbK (DUF882 family)